jgi:maltose O-acetyltransferase
MIPPRPVTTARSPRRHWHVRVAIVRAVLGAIPAFSMNRLRAMSLRACGVRMGPSTWFWGIPDITGPGPIRSRLRIGAHCGFNEGCLFDLGAPISIGDRVAAGHCVRFLTSSGEQDAHNAAPITIGDGVWLGARCTILGGVTVGAGSVIGAGVTVSSDIAPNMLVFGSRVVSLASWR